MQQTTAIVVVPDGRPSMAMPRRARDRPSRSRAFAVESWRTERWDSLRSHPNGPQVGRYKGNDPMDP